MVKVIEEVTQEKIEKIAELKEKADLKRKEKDAEIKAMQEEMDSVKKNRIQEVNDDFELRKKELLSGKD